MAASAYITLTAKDNVTYTLKKIQGEMEAVARSVRTFGDNFASLATLGFGTGLAVSLYEIGKASVEAQMQVERLGKAFGAIYGNAAQAQQQLDFIRKTSRELGQEFYSTAEAAKTFFAAGQGTSLSSQLNEIYTGFSKAGSALGLTTDDMQGLFLALGQSISKGKVQAEELRGQIGERLPGAFQIAAKAMGMSTAELDKFMADGKLLAEDLLPAMAEALEEKYGRAAESSADTVQGSINRLSTAWTDFKANLLESDLVIAALNAIGAAVERINKALGDERQQKSLTQRMLADKEYLVNRSWQEREGTFWGIFPQREQIYDFTPAQKAAYAEYEKIKAAFDAYDQQRQAEEERTLGNFRQAAAGVAKTTYEGQAKALKELRDERIKAATEARSFLADPSEADKLIADAKAQYERDKAALDKKFSDKASSSARQAAVAQADYNGELERTRQTIDSLQQQLGLDKTEDLARAKIRIEQQYQATLSKTNEELAKQVAQGKLTQGQADTLKAEKDKAAELQKQVALRDAEQKAQERQYKDLQTAADFYKELGDLSGEYGESLEYQNRLIEQQAQLWLQTGIPLSDVERRVELMREEMARDPFSGMVRGARKWAAETTDYAASVEQALTGTFDRATDAFAEFVLTGKMNLADLGNYFLQTLAVIGSRQAIGGIVGGLTSALGSVVGGFFGGTFSSSQLSTMESNGMRFSGGSGSWLTGVHGHHRGGVVGISAPTFTRSVPALAFAGAPRFHSGGGWFARDEYPAILQRGERVLSRDETRAYHAGMQAGGYRGSSSGKEPAVYVVINNTTGEQVSQQRSRDGNGNTRIDVLVGNVAARQAITPGSNLNRAIRGTTGSRQSVIGR